MAVLPPKKDRSLELTSVFHEGSPGRRKIAVKVVDIFGNDTMTILEVNVPGKKWHLPQQTAVIPNPPSYLVIPNPRLLRVRNLLLVAQALLPVFCWP